VADGGGRPRWNCGGFSAYVDVFAHMWRFCGRCPWSEYGATVVGWLFAATAQFLIGWPRRPAFLRGCWLAVAPGVCESRWSPVGRGALLSGGTPANRARHPSLGSQEEPQISTAWIYVRSGFSILLRAAGAANGALRLGGPGCGLPTFLRQPASAERAKQCAGPPGSRLTNSDVAARGGGWRPQQSPDLSAPGARGGR